MKTFLIWAVILTGVAYGGAKAYLHNEVADAMDTAVFAISPYAKVQYDGVRSTMSGELTIEGIRIDLNDFQDNIHIRRVGIDTPSFLSLLSLTDYMSLQGDGIPESFGFLVEGMQMATNADYFRKIYAMSSEMRGGQDAGDPAAVCTGKYGFSPDALGALGYSEQVFSMAMTVRNDARSFGIDVTSSVEGMWDVDASVTLAGNLTNDMVKGASYRPRMSSMSIDYTDRSLNDRVRKYCKSLGLTDEKIVEAQMDTFKYFGESNGIVFDDYLLVPYQEFLDGKKRIVITAKPNEPIAMSQIDLYKASDVPALLNLEATAY